MGAAVAGFLSISCLESAEVYPLFGRREGFLTRLSPRKELDEIAPAVHPVVRQEIRVLNAYDGRR